MNASIIHTVAGIFIFIYCRELKKRNFLSTIIICLSLWTHFEFAVGNQKLLSFYYRGAIVSSDTEYWICLKIIELTSQTIRISACVRLRMLDYLPALIDIINQQINLNRTLRMVNWPAS